ncbi:hypothetical protein FDP41_006288 [Naegleria fowleri]|uniref:Tyrosine specific protein phosphatases domain-containing protein n=1 Tax=Naegleria fowleri TaxID=5763 RepID=A0A6A5BL94_NAEFO|nr:uncharacterized protein FDP41_006288 [Naegleria fowleri]KAF0974814.1 hypothetical protein FDP41_006288 [Naegleria fowleri]
MTKKGGKTAASLKKSSSGNYEYNPKRNVIDVIPDLTPVVTLPPLPSDRKNIDPVQYRGPSDYSNWLIPNHVCVGGYPRSKEVDSIVSSGISTFVNLVEDDEELRCGPFYYDHASRKSTLPKLNYVTFPIRDKNIAEDDKVKELVQLLRSLVMRGEKLYIHCVGGHGRTGTIASLLLGNLYNLPAYDSLHWVQAFHDVRTVTNGRKSPESTIQRDQVFRLLSDNK